MDTNFFAQIFTKAVNAQSLDGLPMKAIDRARFKINAKIDQLNFS
jgi:hypothetical protein